MVIFIEVANSIRAYRLAVPLTQLPVLDPLAHLPTASVMIPREALGVTVRVMAPKRAYSGGMTLTLHLPGELAAALEAEAARRGQSPDEVATELLAERLPPAGARRRLAFAGVGSSASGRSAVDADDMLAEGFGRDE